MGTVRKLTKSGNTFTSSTIATGFSLNYYTGLSVSADGTLVYLTDPPRCQVYEVSYNGTGWTKSLIAGAATYYIGSNGYGTCGNKDGAWPHSRAPGAWAEQHTRLQGLAPTQGSTIRPSRLLIRQPQAWCM